MSPSSSHSALDRSAYTVAAVLLPLFVCEGVLSLLLTKRTEDVRHHKGQICFPGGAQEDSDASLWHTALRETEEEIGLAPERIRPLGQLLELTTPTGFHVTAFTGLIREPGELQPNAAEIAAVLHVPLAHFFNPENLHFETRYYAGEPHEMPFYAFGEHIIWGATGRMILELVNRLMDADFRQQWSKALPELSDWQNLISAPPFPGDPAK